MNAQKRKGQPTLFQPLHGREPGSGGEFPLTEEQRERARPANFWPLFNEVASAWPSVREDFDQLVQHGCDPEFLAHTVVAIRLAHQVYKKRRASDSSFALPGNGFEALAGFPRKKLTRVVGRMRRCAEEIRRLHTGFLASLVPSGNQQVVHYIELQSRLPFDLNDLAGIIEKAERHLRLRGRPEYDQDIAALVRHVESRTGKPHDREVATMIAFATDNPDFNADDLRTWRTQHQDLQRSSTKT